MAFLNALFTAALDNNLVFAQLIGMVSVILIAARPQDSWRFGVMIAIATAGAPWVGLCIRRFCSLGASRSSRRSLTCS